MATQGFVGQFPTVALLEEKFPAAKYTGRGALVGHGNTLSEYLSTGDKWEPVPHFSTDSSGNVTGLVGPDGSAYALGLSVAPSGTDDTAAINAKLADLRLSSLGRSVLKLQPGGTYRISSRLIIGSNTLLDARGATIILLPGSNTNMITSWATSNPAATGTATTTSGSNVISTALGAVAQVGQSLTVYGAGGAGTGTLVGIVRSATPTTITLEKFDRGDAPATASVTAQTAKLYTRDRDIQIVGGVWNRGANGPNSGVGAPESAVPGHSILMKHVDGLLVDIERAYSTAGISFVWITDCTRWSASVRDADCVRTVMQIVGPNMAGDIPIVRGACNDDLINICGNVYTDQTDTCGDIMGVNVGAIQADGVGGSALKLNAGAGCAVNGVSVAHISGRANVGFFVGDDYAYSATTGGTYGPVRIGYLGTTGYNANPKSIYLWTPACKAIIIDNADLLPFDPIWSQGSSAVSIDYLKIKANVTSTVQTYLMRCFQSTSIKQLVLEGWTAALSGNSSSLLRVYGTAVVNRVVVDKPVVTFSGTNTDGVRVYETGRIDEVVLRDFDVTYSDTAGTSCLVYASAGTITETAFQGGKMKNGAALCRLDSGVTSSLISVSDTLVDTPDRMLNIRNAACDVFIGDAVRAVTPALPMILFNNASGVYAVRGQDIQCNTATAKLARNTGTEAITVFAPTLGVDLSILPKTANQMATNTNAGLACGVGPATAGGVAWKNTYSGATY